MEEIFIKSDEIKLLKWPEAIRQRIGMYLGGTDKESVNNMIREIVDNSLDEVQQTADTVVIDCDFNGFYAVMDNGRGISIEYSKDVPDKISADLSISELHSGSKFTDNKTATIGMNGVGSSSVCACSEDYILMSRITPINYDKSSKEVLELWNSCGPRSKKDLFYIVWYKKGIKFYEGAVKKSQAESMIFGKNINKEIPTGMSTIVFFNPDPTIFEDTTKMEVPYENLQYFLLIQEKFYKKRVKIYANGEEVKPSGLVGFNNEILTTIIPADTSMNPKVGLYIAVGYDPELGPKQEFGSVNSLKVDSGAHINYIEDCFTKALKAQFGIKHKYTTTGLKLCVVALASEVTFASQTKEKLKNFVKVGLTDFNPIIKEFQKIFRKDADYWNEYVEKLNFLADSMKSLSAADKAQKIIDDAAGRGLYKAKQEMIPGLSDATAGANERWNCELFLCFTGDTKILTCNEEKISFNELVPRIESGESIYTVSCTPEGEIVPSKIIAAKKIKEVSKLCKITLDNGEEIKCTPDHKFLMRSGEYKPAGELNKDDSLMPCYITASDNYDGVNRRVILDMKPRNTKVYRPDEFSTANNGTLVPMFHIMSNHPDVNKDDSIMEVGVVIHRHHINKNRFDDNPTNILLCSQEKHFSFHCDEVSRKAHEAAHRDPEIYRKMYIDNKRTESFKENASKGHKAYYESEAGDKMRQHLKEASIREWEDEDLRKWRSEETRKFAAEHPDWVKENTIKGKSSFWISKVIPAVDKYILDNGLDNTSRSFNYAILNLTLPTKNREHWPEFDKVIKYIPELTEKYNKVQNDSIDYLKTEKVLDVLSQKNLPVNTKNFNSIFIELFEKPSGSENISYGGYRYSRSHFPELMATYEAKLNNNHKVVSVEFLDVENEPVYCLEVDSIEHNFPLAAGVFVSNCEGLSPGGSLKAARKNTKFIGVAPLRGKVKNVKDSTADQMMDNKELFTIFKLMGLGIDVNNVTKGCKTPEEAYEKIKKYARFGKLVIATDADEDGLAIQNGLLYAISKFARFMLDFGLVYVIESPIFEQGGKYFYPSDPRIPGTQFCVGMDPSKHYRRFKGLGALDQQDVYNAFYDESKRRLFRVTTDGIDISMELVENIDARKQLLRDKNILTNPYNFTDI